MGKKVLMSFCMLGMLFLFTACGNTNIDRDGEDKNLQGDDTVLKIQQLTGENFENYKEYNLQDSISFKYPSDWTLTTEAGITQVVSPLEHNDVFAENFNIIIQSLSKEKIDFEKYYTLNLKGIENMLSQKNGLIVSTQKVELGRVKGYRLIYTFEMEGVRVQATQYFFNPKDNACIITFINNERKREEKKEEFAKVINSINFF